MELREFVCLFGVIVGAICIYAGLRLLFGGFARAMTPGGPRFEPATRRMGGVSGLVFALFGAALIFVVGMATIGPWRVPEPAPFPMHVLDLRTPPAEIERPRPPTPEPGAETTPDRR